MISPSSNMQEDAVTGNTIAQKSTDGAAHTLLVGGTNNIGDVDIVTVPAPLSTTGGGTEAAALRVTLANDSTGVVSVDDNGGSLTVDGTVTANLAAGTNNIGDVDVLTLPPIPAGTNNIGDVDVLTLPSIPAGTNNIGGVTGTGIHVAASVDVNSAIAADVDLAIAAAAGTRLVGFAARESAATAAAATFIILHGTAAAGTAVIPVELKADESTREWFGPDGIAVPNGVSIDWIAGTVDVHLFYKVVA